MTDPRQDMDGVEIENVGEGTAQVVIQPGASVEPLGATKTARVFVKDGAVRVTISKGSGHVEKGTGQPIASGAGGSVFCDRDKCNVKNGDSVVLTVGNTCFVQRGVLEFAVVGDKPAELHVSAQPGDTDDADTLPSGVQTFSESKIKPLRCWVCPFM